MYYVCFHALSSVIFDLTFRNFSFHRAFLQAITPYVNDGLKFTLHILQGARMSYRSLLDDKKRSVLIELSDQHNELGAVEEVRYVHDCCMFASIRKSYLKNAGMVVPRGTGSRYRNCSVQAIHIPTSFCQRVSRLSCRDGADAPTVHVHWKAC